MSLSLLRSVGMVSPVSERPSPGDDPGDDGDDDAGGDGDGDDEEEEDEAEDIPVCGVCVMGSVSDGVLAVVWPRRTTDSLGLPITAPVTPLLSQDTVITLTPPTPDYNTVTSDLRSQVLAEFSSDLAEFSCFCE